MTKRKHKELAKAKYKRLAKKKKGGPGLHYADTGKTWSGSLWERGCFATRKLFLKCKGKPHH